MSWEQYVRRVIGADQQKVAAEKAKIDQSAISRWLKTGKPGLAENVAAFARGYRRPVLEAFVAAGFLTETEAKARPAVAPDFTTLTNDELLELVRARMREEGELGGDTAATKPDGPFDEDLDALPHEKDDPPPRGGLRGLPAAARKDDK